MWQIVVFFSGRRVRVDGDEREDRVRVRRAAGRSEERRGEEECCCS